MYASNNNFGLCHQSLNHLDNLKSLQRLHLEDNKLPYFIIKNVTKVHKNKNKLYIYIYASVHMLIYNVTLYNKSLIYTPAKEHLWNV